MKRKSKIGSIMFILLCFVLLSAGHVLAQNVSTPVSTAVPVSPSTAPTSAISPQPPVQTLTTADFTGTLVVKNPNSITVQSGTETKQFQISPNISVVKDGLNSNFNNLQVNDQVTVTYDQFGNALKITAVSGNVIDYAKILLIAGIIIIIILIIIAAILITKNRDKTFIKTKVART